MLVLAGMVVLVMEMILLGACTGAGAGGNAAAAPGVASGTVTDANGNPLGDVEVRVGGTTGAGERTWHDVTTDSDGRYALELEDSGGIYHVRAWVNTEYNGYSYRLPLHPADGEAKDFEADDGHVEDFVWRLSGLMADAPEASQSTTDYYGGSIAVYDEEIYMQDTGRGGDVFAEFPEFPEGSVIRVTLTPKGPVIDGSEGEALTFEPQPLTTIPDVPIGRYTAEAQLVQQGGATTPLRLAAQPDPYCDGRTPANSPPASEPASSAIVEFLPQDPRRYAANGLCQTTVYAMY